MRPAGPLVQGLQEFAKTLPRDGLVIEVGSYAGESALIFAQHVARVICVDPWETYPEARGHPRAYMLSGQEVENAFDKATRHLVGKIIKVKMPSVSAALFFTEQIADAVYLDGRHDLLNLMADIGAWERKVKKTGVLAGHDFTNKLEPGVAEAVAIVFGKPDKVYVDGTWAVLGARCGLVQGKRAGA